MLNQKKENTMNNTNYKKNKKTMGKGPKGPHSKDMLGDRMKFLESMTTEQYLLPGVPMYARLDGRSFHKLTRGMNHPFDEDFKNVLQTVAAFLVEETHAKLSYVQSDEISLGYFTPEDSYFEGRIFKLQSVLASVASAKFVYECMKIPRLAAIIDKIIPSFDCRVMNIPTVQELANMFLFRENDAAKNGISQLAFAHFSPKQLYKKRGDEKIEMLRDIGIEYNDIDIHYQRGTFFHRVNRRVELSEEIIQKIPEDRRNYEEDGKIYAVRSFIEPLRTPARLTECVNKAGVLFNNEEFIFKEKKQHNGYPKPKFKKSYGGGDADNYDRPRKIERFDGSDEVGDDYNDSEEYNHSEEWQPDSNENEF